ncbi:class I SAM-dependent methyltransferase [Hansschlegelia plantiphila]|uniref:ATP synthase subunit beta n=1 Tax=Hansschlegelia plantiphila TaxID=374655 RepID=A0A9W6J112_9HYPH|nr:class I SAM-dependent methyltransferase [Hansschlegelia plantiphila]GLK67791.1 ATP synthase subunit beta [Hansschlegelia plantiphila]
MTPLGREIAALISAEGPISVARYMALCLGHPEHGYYATRDPFGPAGDFVTAPEISQMFGELIGLWCAAVWTQMGAPKRVALIELGPGRGTLMADMLRAAKAAPDFRDAVAVTLVETSPTLRAVQERTLQTAGVAVRWAATVDEALDHDHPVVAVANEFFDALPIRQFARTAAGWRERLVGLSDEGALVFGLAPEAPSDLDPPERPTGALLEVCPEALAIAARLGGHVAAHGGAALAIDYGSGFSAGDTLQAVRAHGFVDPLAEPGEADLTAHVDFGALAAAARSRGATAMRLATQGDLLDALGLAARAAQLCAKASDAQRDAIVAAVARLTDRAPTGMGALFKALAFADPRLGPLPGFAPSPSSAPSEGPTP